MDPSTIDEIFEERTDGILEPKNDSIHSDYNDVGDLRLSIEVEDVKIVESDPYEDIKLDLQL